MEKGVIKDLIISGDAAFQTALEKFEKGDKDSIVQYCKSLSARKGSVDLLENMDLDFAFEDKSTTEAFFATVSALNDKTGAPYVASKRRPSIDTHIRSNSIFGISDADQPLTAFNSSVFDDSERHVELSAYAAMAKSLSGSKTVSKPYLKASIGRTTPARPSSRGFASTGAVSAVEAPIACSLQSPLGAAAVTEAAVEASSSLSAAVSSVPTSSTVSSVSTSSTSSLSATGSAVSKSTWTVTTSETTNSHVRSVPRVGTMATSICAGTSVTRAPSPAGQSSMVAAVTRVSPPSQHQHQHQHQHQQPSSNAPVSVPTSQSKVPLFSTSPIVSQSGVSVKSSVNAGPNAISANKTKEGGPPGAVPVPPTAPGDSSVLLSGVVSSAISGNSNGSTTSTTSTVATVPNPAGLGTQSVISLTIAGGPLWAKAAEGPESRQFIGAYSPEQRRKRIERFIEKRNRRVWTKKVKYDVRKNFADSRLRVKGRFVKKEDEEIMRELMTI